MSILSRKDCQTDAWRKARLCVWKQNKSNLKKTKNIMNYLADVIHKIKRNAAGNSEKVVHPVLA